MVVREHGEEVFDSSPPPPPATTAAAKAFVRDGGDRGDFQPCPICLPRKPRSSKLRRQQQRPLAIQTIACCLKMPPELEKYVKMLGFLGRTAINKDPKSVQIVIAAVDETKRLGGAATDRTRSLMEELARKQQEKKADTSGLTVEERIQLNKTQRIKGTTPINLIAMLRPTGSGSSTPSLDLLVILKLDEPVLQVYNKLAGEGFDTPDKLVLFLEQGDEQTTRANLNEVISHPEDVARIAKVLPLLEDMQRCKEALDSASSQDAIDQALDEYQRIAKLLN
ncbi:hypothetical protein BASA81_012589 [Batrachochytrium salamandrivorans]|nr:hypothetical protein BASA81_012589 [Batrachochytrium salamandrivorans]